MNTNIYTHPSFIKHETPQNHPERPERLKILLEALSAHTIIETNDYDENIIVPLILQAHTKNHLAWLEESVIEDEITCIDNQDTYLSDHSLAAAYQGVSNICQAIDDLKNNDIKNKKSSHAFCLSRPPGHHAEPAKAMGFCLFNNIYCGALYAQSIGFEKIAIVDFDVHHGNGTQAMFEKHKPEDMIFISTHEMPLYPWTGKDSKDNIYNYPLPTNSNGAYMRSLYGDTILPQLDEFRPDLVLISAGFDAHKDDIQANLNWDESDYEWLGNALSKYQTASILEGGYNLDALKHSVLAYVNGLDAS